MSDTKNRRHAPTSTQTIKAVLWDLDGTLVQTEALHAALDLAIVSDLGVPFDAATFHQRFTGGTTRAAFEAILGEAGKGDLVEEAMRRKMADAPTKLIDRALPTRGAEFVLREIPMRTHRFALVTSAERLVAEGILARFSWAWRFEVVVTANDVTQPKPASQPYEMALSQMGLKASEALVVEDSVTGIRAGKAAGCKVAALPGSFPQAELHEADYLLSNIQAVMGLLTVLG